MYRRARWYSAVKYGFLVAAWAEEAGGLGMGTEVIGGPGHVLGRKNIRAARQPQP